MSTVRPVTVSTLRQENRCVCHTSVRLTMSYSYRNFTNRIYGLIFPLLFIDLYNVTVKRCSWYIKFSMVVGIYRSFLPNCSLITTFDCFYPRKYKGKNPPSTIQLVWRVSSVIVNVLHHLCCFLLTHWHI